MTAAPDPDAALKRAKRFARRGVKCRSDQDRRSTFRQMMNSLYLTLKPKPDGTHPLDPENLKLEGE